MARLKQGQTARNVACLIWEEDLIRDGRTYGDLLAFCEGLNVPCAVSPWHNQDRYTADDVRKWVDRHIDPDFYDFISEDIEEVRKRAPRVGDVKKSHAHILLKNSGPRNRDFYTKMFRDFVRIPPSKWEVVDNLDAYICYLCHKHTPSKHRYSEMDVHGFGGIDLSPLLSIDKMEKVNVGLIIDQKIEDDSIRYYHKLVAWAKSTKDYDIISYVKGNTSYYSALFRSMRDWRIDEASKAKAAKGNE